jgi:protein-S-isoprenylcysteine O-methyltransferase Ste14
MDSLAKRALIGLARFQVVLALLILLPAWSLSYWQGWLYWALFGACCLVLTLYFLRRDPSLVERRMNVGPVAERERKQKVIQSFAAVLVCALFVVSALDHRFGRPSLGWPVVLIGDAFVLLGFYAFFRTFRENSFASSIIEVGSGQKVVDTGPYALVRHPMYAGALLMFFGTPPALDSVSGFVPAALLAAVIVWRLLGEEAYLARNLPGYDDYRRKVRWRLVPGVW